MAVRHYTHATNSKPSTLDGFFYPCKTAALNPTNSLSSQLTIINYRSKLRRIQIPKMCRRTVPIMLKVHHCNTPRRPIIEHIMPSRILQVYLQLTKDNGSLPTLLPDMETFITS